LGTTLSWTIFAIIVIVALAIDLGLLNRKAHVMRFREALTWAVGWIALAALFAAWVYVRHGVDRGLQFTTGYLIELSLSADNVFLFAVIFRQFGLGVRYQHRVLYWGILGAIVMRGIMIAAGTALIARFHWVTFVFGVFLILTGLRMFVHRDREVDVADMAIIRWLQNHMRVTADYDGQRFLTVRNGIRYATPMLIVLIVIELTDLMFAVDSIPAVLAISQDPFIVFTSNIFAILGLRSFYFLLAGVMGMFEYLTVGLSAVLVFVGVKMLGFVEVPTLVSLAVITTIIAVAVIASLIKARLHPSPVEPPIMALSDIVDIPSPQDERAEGNEAAKLR
jgi:tellurite resistance protein TerC